MKLQDTLALAFRTVRSNKLRTGITVAIIAFGIMALVGINTAIDAMKQKFTESFSAMGANGFTLHYKNWWGGGFNRSRVKSQKKSALKEKKSNTGVPITKMQAESCGGRPLSSPDFCREETPRLHPSVSAMAATHHKAVFALQHASRQ